METKYFRSKYNTIHKGIWKKTIDELGINVYDVVVPCEFAVVLGGFFENPSAFKDVVTLVFYRKDKEKDASMLYDHDYDRWLSLYRNRIDMWVSMLENYFDELVDLTGLNPKESAEKIRSTVETYQ